MKKSLAIPLIVSFLTISLCILAFAGGISPAKFCKQGGAALIEVTLEDALYDAHGIEVDLNISQGACVSTVATHNSAKGVNTKALATDFCKQIVGEGKMIRGCVEHVEPTLRSIFHP